ncbi:nucleotide sugar dehydrogenase [Salinibacter ruber]|uniref:nucleotide sugar dehydrogenase n=1 Tax=Salinibacter ruber TaxID=146919 RepID=UPI002072D629|nr:nucleotide sugar dehydrogenase [Salinibacter ruber]
MSTNEHAPADQLRRCLQQKTATIGVIGLGYVGLPLAVEYADQDFSTIGIDLDETRVQKLNDGVNYNDDLDDERIRRLVAEGHLRATSSYDEADDIDVFFVCVPTPVTEHKDPDTTYIEAATASIAEHLRPGQLVILKSTTYPTTTETVVQPLLEDAAAEKGLRMGEDVFLAFSPERIDPGNETYTLENTPVVVGGVTPTATDLAEQVTAQVVGTVHTVSSARVAEMEKLLENIYRSVNIALVNELAQLCDRIGVSMWEVVEAAATKPFGFQAFYPGPGLGGHCIPVDPHYLSWLAREYDFETSFITLSARVNEEMPHYVTNAVVQAVANQPIRLSDASVLLLGVAFKPNVDDTRHSPAYTVTKLLRERGVDTIRFADPHVEQFRVSEPDGEELPSVNLTPEVIQSHDVAVVLADHDAFDYEHIATHSSCVVDTRNAVADNVDGELPNVRTLGGGGFRDGATPVPARGDSEVSEYERSF